MLGICLFYKMEIVIQLRLCGRVKYTVCSWPSESSFMKLSSAHILTSHKEYGRTPIFFTSLLSSILFPYFVDSEMQLLKQLNFCEMGMCFVNCGGLVGSHALLGSRQGSAVTICVSLFFLIRCDTRLVFHSTNHFRSTRGGIVCLTLTPSAMSMKVTASKLGKPG